jgi:excisionase family DNA binding protein
MNTELLTRRQAAAYIGVQPHTLAVWACTHRQPLPYVRIGRLVKYRKADLDAFIESNICSPSQNAQASLA